MNDLYEQIAQARMHVELLEKELRDIQKRCKHSYVHERECDGHTTKSVYTCEKCGDFTLMRPCPENMSKGAIVSPKI